jgi:alginate O-acetyltransferase complex protein AlgJ
MARDSILRWIPQAVAAAVFLTMLCAGVLVLVRPLLEPTRPWIFRGLVPELAGVRIAREPVALTLPSVMTGHFQKEADSWVGDNVPQRALVVRSFNEALWDTFGGSYMAQGSLVRGRQGTLFEIRYILRYCGIVKSDMRDVSAFAARLRKVQDWFAARGQRFVYFLSPPKPYWFPDRIPASFPCGEDVRDKDYAPTVRIMENAGINIVDARAALEKARGTEPAALYPINGIHWNWLGAAVGAQALADKVRSLGVPDLPGLSYTVEIEPDESEAFFDRDLSSLLNLLTLPRGAPAPKLHVVAAPAASSRCRVAAVNTSYLGQPAYLAQTAKIFESFEANYYFFGGRRYLPDWTDHAINRDDPAAYDSIFKADIVILEELGSRIGAPYSLLFLEMVEREMARKPDEVPAYSDHCAR